MADGASSTNSATDSGTDSGTSHAIVAGGCFWGVQHLLRNLEGVVATEVGYCGGHTKNPTYREICTGKTGHAEALRIEFDPARVHYEDVLRYFFRLHDPTTLNRQHNDIGPQYRSSIFPQDAQQRAAAASIIAEEDASGRHEKSVVTKIEESGPWWPAEAEHQDYLEKNPGGYNCHILRD